MSKSFLNFLESPEHPLLSPNMYSLKISGMLQSKSFFPRAMRNALHLFATIFCVSQYIELWIIRHDIQNALRNLSVTILSTTCVVKAWTFILWQEHWKQIIESVSAIERAQLSNNDQRTKDIIADYTKYARKVTGLYCILVTTTVATVILAPYGSFLSTADYDSATNSTIRYPEMLSSWVPFDKSQSYGYWATIVIDIIIVLNGGCIVASYDSNAIVLMYFFTGQLKLLKANCARVFGQEDEVVTDQEALEKIASCHRHHSFLVRYIKLLDSMLSPVLFFYVVICSTMICASAVQLTKKGTTRMQQIWIAEYLMALITQLFIYCWHSNEVFLMSKCVEAGAYESNWWSRKVSLQRNIILLGGKLRKVVLFRAGPFTLLTMPSFVMILKGSYSYYAVLIQKNDTN